MKKNILFMNLCAIILCLFASCENELTTEFKKTNCQISYDIEAMTVSNHDFSYNGELTDGQISSIYRMVLSTYGDCGFYRYITFSEAMTEKQIKSLAVEFGNKADDVVRSQYDIPNDVYPAYNKLKVKVYYVFDNQMVQVIEFDYLK